MLSISDFKHHPRTCKWLGSPPFTGNFVHLEGECPRLRAYDHHGYYPSTTWDDPPSRRSGIRWISCFTGTDQASTVMRFARGEPASDLSDLLLALFTYWTLGVKILVRFYMDFCLRGSNKGLEVQRWDLLNFTCLVSNKLRLIMGGNPKGNIDSICGKKTTSTFLLATHFFFRKETIPNQKTRPWGNRGSMVIINRGISRSRKCVFIQGVFILLQQITKHGNEKYEAWSLASSCCFPTGSTKIMDHLQLLWYLNISIYIFGWSDLEKSRVATGTKDH